jgi:hypothetical protein
MSNTMFIVLFYLLLLLIVLFEIMMFKALGILSRINNHMERLVPKDYVFKRKEDRDNIKSAQSNIKEDFSCDVDSIVVH